MLTEIANGAASADGITDNPKKFGLVETENATRPHALPDVDAAFATISFALPAGLSSDQAIPIEGDDSTYFNILVTRRDPSCRTTRAFRSSTSCSPHQRLPGSARIPGAGSSFPLPRFLIPVPDSPLPDCSRCSPGCSLSG
ncbi:MetQ/NlpA family ABC transporter substrate-binding protein [Salinibacterium xinjiangense]|uniref:MetQ/NlpA family ABC transporter substrate-binding protein n=1 Tax=Salinibacterium xinjiangense TaxID=386302 RepID=UPI001E3166B9|nr:MetQ/NlpA family ABC transporter substrate-binding protein [Salinibacterium xinjiangense]